ncbi:MAG: SDR family oxidoreductase [Candidatus Omnitrophica bacterium]|nr:SDR family oxidoreductase [Candidatus Omnitrophota bacterium]MCM8790659.1 SDR family oxidoreductase [Candidatus Omnitrophota bacterium]
MANYLVTGGAGFIGSNIVEELVRKKDLSENGIALKVNRVRVIDNLITGKLENLKPFLGQVEFIKGDIRSAKTLARAMKGIDYVIHQAALRSVPKSVEDPFTTNDINVFGTLNLLMAAKKAGVKRVVYASSSSAYGDAKSFPQRETDLPKPISPYGVSKLAAENYCITFAKTFGLETVSLRYFNVFGPRQNPESKYSAVIPAFLFRMMEGKSPIVEWDGRQSRDFTYVGNVVEANLRACVMPGISGEVFNVACGSTISIIDIVKELNRILGTDIKPVFAPKRKGDVRKTRADVSKMRRLLKMKKTVGFTEGLERTVEWFRSRRCAKKPF